MFASPSVSNILGWKPEELVGRSCERLMADEAGNALNVVEERQGEPSPPASGGPPARPRPTRTTRQLAASDGTVRWLARCPSFHLALCSPRPVFCTLSTF